MFELPATLLRDQFTEHEETYTTESEMAEAQKDVEHTDDSTDNGTSSEDSHDCSQSLEEVQETPPGASEGEEPSQESEESPETNAHTEGLRTTQEPPHTSPDASPHAAQLQQDPDGDTDSLIGLSAEDLCKKYNAAQLKALCLEKGLLVRNKDKKEVLATRLEAWNEAQVGQAG